MNDDKYKLIANLVLNQKNIYNGNGQLEISEMGIEDLMGVCRYLNKLLPLDEDGYYTVGLSCGVEEGDYEGEIVYEFMRERKKLMFSVQSVTIPSEKEAKEQEYTEVVEPLWRPIEIW